MFGFSDTKSSREDLREKESRGDLAFVLSAPLAKSIEEGNTSPCNLENLCYIVSYMRDYDIKRFSLQPREKYTIVLSDSENGYLIEGI